MTKEICGEKGFHNPLVCTYMDQRHKHGNYMQTWQTSHVHYSKKRVDRCCFNVRRLPHIPGKTAGHHWPSVALCGQPGQWQEWVGAPSFLGEEEEVEGAKNNSEFWLFLHQNCTRINTNIGGTTKWVKLLVGPWCGCERWEKCCLFNNAWPQGGGEDLKREGDREKQKDRARERLVILGNIVMLNEKDRGGTGTEMHMRGWVSLFLEGNRRQTSLWLHNAQLVTEVGSEQEPTLVTANQSHCQFPERRKKKPWLVTSQNSFLWKSSLTIDYLLASPGALGQD